MSVHRTEHRPLCNARLIQPCLYYSHGTRLGTTPEVRDDHAAYLGHWLTVLKRAIFSAAAHAQRAADFPNSLQRQQQAESTAA
jgi:antirestriction protein ArdC